LCIAFVGRWLRSSEAERPTLGQTSRLRANEFQSDDCPNRPKITPEHDNYRDAAAERERTEII